MRLPAKYSAIWQNESLSRSNNAMREGIQLSEALTGDGAAIFRHPRPISRHTGSRYVSGRTRALVWGRL
jgi:hypothetical protein